MKKRIAVVLALVMVCTFAGCKKTNVAGHGEGMIGQESEIRLSEEISMQLAGTNQVGTLTFYRIHNPTEVRYTYGAEYMIEVFQDGKWYTTNYGPKDVTAQGYSLLEGNMNDQAFTVHESLPEGKYRYIKKMSPADDPKDTFYVGMEFSVGPTVPMPAAGIETFSTLEEFEQAALTGQTGVANMAALHRYCLPTGLPEEYRLYKITVTGADIAFWYLPEADLISEEAIEAAEDGQKYFKFVDQRIRSPYANDYANMVKSYDSEVNVGSGDMDYIPEENPELLIMRRREEMFFLIMPEGYVPEELAFGTKIYSKQESSIASAFRASDDELGPVAY